MPTEMNLYDNVIFLSWHCRNHIFLLCFKMKCGKVTFFFGRRNGLFFWVVKILIRTWKEKIYNKTPKYSREVTNDHSIIIKSFCHHLHSMMFLMFIVAATAPKTMAHMTPDPGPHIVSRPSSFRTTPSGFIVFCCKFFEVRIDLKSVIWRPLIIFWRFHSCTFQILTRRNCFILWDIFELEFWCNSEFNVILKLA